MRPPEEVKKDLVQQWLNKAEQDINAGEALFANFVTPAGLRQLQERLDGLLSRRKIISGGVTKASLIDFLIFCFGKRQSLDQCTIA